MPERTARRQHAALAQVTATRIARMAGQVQEDCACDRPVSVDVALQIVTAALTLYREAVAIAVRDEIMARAAREAAA